MRSAVAPGKKKDRVHKSPVFSFLSVLSLFDLVNDDPVPDLFQRLGSEFSAEVKQFVFFFEGVEKGDLFGRTVGKRNVYNFVIPAQIRGLELSDLTMLVVRIPGHLEQSVRKTVAVD